MRAAKVQKAGWRQRVIPDGTKQQNLRMQCFSTITHTGTRSSAVCSDSAMQALWALTSPYGHSRHLRCTPRAPGGRSRSACSSVVRPHGAIRELSGRVAICGAPCGCSRGAMSSAVREQGRSVCSIAPCQCGKEGEMCAHTDEGIGEEMR